MTVTLGGSNTQNNGGQAARPHAVVMPWPGQGHINPLLHFAKRLLTKGYTVTFVNTDYTHKKVVQSIDRQQKEVDALENGHSTRHANGAAPAETTNRLNFVSLPDGVPPEETRTSNVPEISRGLMRTAAALEELLETLDPPATCIISDTYVLHTQDAANKFRIPRVSFWTQSAACYAVHAAVAKGVVALPSGELKADRELILEHLIRNISGIPPLRLEDMPGFLQCCDGADFMFDFCIRPFLRAPEAACVLFNSFEELEGEVINGLRQDEPNCKFYSIGPVLPAQFFSEDVKLDVREPMNRALAYFPENFECLKWLDEQKPRSVLYISFGSVAELTGSELEEFALGLEASGVPLLWVLRPGLLEGGGAAALPPGFTERTKDRVLIIEWSPQLHVLAHPSVGAFLTHAGWNSTMEGVAKGLPMLGFPYFADQMINCRFIEEVWGNGLAFDRQGGGKLTRGLVEQKVRAIMGVDGGAQKLRERALYLRNAARQAVTVGSSITSLATVLEHMQ